MGMFSESVLHYPEATGSTRTETGLAQESRTLPHIESKFHVREQKWTDPESVEQSYIPVEGLSTVLNFGQHAIEGLKSCRASNNDILLFRPADHAARLNRLSADVSIPELPVSHFINCVRNAITINADSVPSHESGAFLYIRCLIFGSSAQLPPLPSEEYTFAVFVQPLMSYMHDRILTALVLEEPEPYPTRRAGSIGGNYAPMMKFSERARQKGHIFNLLLDFEDEEYVRGFSTSAFLAIKYEGGEQSGADDNGIAPSFRYTLVANLTTDATDSITQESCMKIARSLGWKTEERKIPFSEVASFDEVIAAGTGASLLEIHSLVRESTSQKLMFYSSQSANRPDERTGCQILREALLNIQSGTEKDDYGWIVKIGEENDN